MTFSTSELCDRNPNLHLQIADPVVFRHYGAIRRFHGKIATLKAFEDDLLIRKTLEQPGLNRVLVIDGGGSHRCSLIDHELAALAVKNQWNGLIVYGCVRNAMALDTLNLGICALHPHPLSAHHRGGGDSDILITFAGVNFRTDYSLYADEDGILVSEQSLL